jgi:hypothetical protein
LRRFRETAGVSWPRGKAFDQLREMGVLVGSYEPQPKAGGGAECFQWEEALELLEGRSADLFGR